MLLGLVCGAQFMVVLDISVVNVALPSIEHGLGFTPARLQWVVNAYALPYAGFLLLGGRLADLLGHRRVFLAGLALFTVASLAGGLATSAEILVAAHAAQGLGAAVLAPATLTILTTSFPEGTRRTRALATWTAAGLAGGAAGNLAGGLLTEVLSWRWTLLINVPLGALGMVLSVRWIRDGNPAGRRRLDVGGAVLATTGLAALTYGVSRAQEHGWGAPRPVLGLTAGALLLVAFVVVETRVATEPLLPLRLFRLRTVSVGNTAMLLAGACLNPMWFFLTLSMQRVLNYSPLLTGLAFLPHTVVAIVVGVRLTPWLMRRVQARTLVATGAVIAAAGFAWQSTLTPGSGYVAGILGPALVFSLGSGLLTTPITTTVTSGLATADAGAASGLMNTTKQFGAALGLAVLVTTTTTTTTAATRAGLATSYGRAFLAIAAALVVVAALAFALPAGKGRVPGRENAPAAEKVH